MNNTITLFFLIASICFVLCGCKSKEEKLKERLYPLVYDVARHSRFVDKIESLEIFKVDSVTDKELKFQEAYTWVYKIAEHGSNESQYREMYEKSHSLRKDYQAIANTFKDSVDMYSEKIESYVKMKNKGAIDSITYNGYLVWFRVCGSEENKKDIRFDSLYIFFSSKFRAIK